MATPPNVDERQPLLPPTVPDEENAIERELEEAEPKKELTWTAIFWYLVLTAFGVFGLVLLVQAFRDASDVDFDLGKALKDALGGGLSGAAAMILQVALLMPLRTIMNYQYRYGTTISQATLTLYNDGGYGRYYQGVGAALFQAPLARFGDTAANAGILALLRSNPFLRKLPSLLKTAFASLTAACFRMILTPIDTLKTTLQTQGKDGWEILRRRIKKYGIGTLWYGAIATAAATFVGHYPWFGTYNLLDEILPPYHTFLQELGRQALMGFAASVVSDTTSNSLRVVKTYRQVNVTKISYLNAARAVVAADGLAGLFLRGLGVRLLTNSLQSIMFSILWKLFLDIWHSHTK